MTIPASLLIIDDAIEIHHLYKTALDAYPITFDSAYNGKQGLEKIAQRSYDMVFLDMAMPEMSGLELLEAISNAEPIVLPLVVVCSSLRTRGLVTQALSLGASSYIFKPIQAGQLQQTVETYLGLFAEQRTKPDKLSAPTPPTAPSPDSSMLTKLMAQMVFTRQTATLKVQTPFGEGMLRYEKGRLVAVSLGGQTGVDALETLKKLPIISVFIAT